MQKLVACTDFEEIMSSEALNNTWGNIKTHSPTIASWELISFTITDSCLENKIKTTAHDLEAWMIASNYIEAIENGILIIYTDESKHNMGEVGAVLPIWK